MLKKLLPVESAFVMTALVEDCGSILWWESNYANYGHKEHWVRSSAKKRQSKTNGTEILAPVGEMNKIYHDVATLLVFCFPIQKNLGKRKWFHCTQTWVMQGTWYKIVTAHKWKLNDVMIIMLHLRFVIQEFESYNNRLPFSHAHDYLVKKKLSSMTRTEKLLAKKW